MFGLIAGFVTSAVSTVAAPVVAVVATVATAAWILNELTESEKENQRAAYRDREKIYSNYAEARKLEKQKAKEIQKQQAEKCYQFLLDIISKHEEKMNQLEKD